MSVRVRSRSFSPPCRTPRNRIRDVSGADPELIAIGIFNGGSPADITDNYVNVLGIGVACADGTGIVHHNRSATTPFPAIGCDDGGGNVSQ